LRKQLRRTAPSGEKRSLWNPYVAVQDHQNGMSSSWRGTRLKTTQIVTRRRDNLAPRKNARHQIRAVVWRLLQIDWAAHPETKRISDWKRSGVSRDILPIKSGSVLGQDVQRRHSLVAAAGDRSEFSRP
jgi:hypothetical protein